MTLVMLLQSILIAASFTFLPAAIFWAGVLWMLRRDSIRMHDHFHETMSRTEQRWGKTNTGQTQN